MFPRIRLLSALGATLVLTLVVGLNPLSSPSPQAVSLEGAPSSGVSASSSAALASFVTPVAKKAAPKYKATKTAKAKAKVKATAKRTAKVTVKVGTSKATASASASASSTKSATAKAKVTAKAKTKAAAKKVAAKKAKVKAKKVAKKKAKASATKSAKAKALKKAKKLAKAKATKKAKAAAAATTKPVQQPAQTPTATRPGGKPGANNTGVPAGTKLTKHTGDLTITKAGTVINGLDIHGYVVVKAKNVTIRNSIIRGGKSAKTSSLVRVDAAGSSLTIEDSELVAANPTPYIDGLRGFNFTARRLNIHGVIDGVHIYGDNAVLEKSWIHNNLHFTNDPNHSDGSHDDGVQIVKGKNISIRNNNIEKVYNAGIMVGQDSGAVSSLRISDNWLDGGKCTLNLSKKKLAPLKSVTIANNVFGRNVTNPAGDDCAITYAKSTDGGMSLSNNVYSDTSKPAKVFIDKNR